MAGKHRKVILLAAIAVLVALNIWRWWPAAHSSSNTTRRAEQAFNIEDFEIKATPIDSPPPLSRDIFYPKRIDVVRPRALASPTQIASAVSPAVARAPEELAKDNAQTEFSQIQCVAISIRNVQVHAYLISGGESSLVSVGDKVGGRFIVEKIVPDGVTLHDPDTGVGGLVTVSGKKD